MLSPQPYTIPSVVMAREWNPPAAIFAALNHPSIYFGVLTLSALNGYTLGHVASPHPHYPKVSSPSPKTRPWWSNAIIWSYPVAISWISLSSLMWTKVLEVNSDSEGIIYT